MKKILFGLLLVAVAGHADARKLTFVIGGGYGDTSQEAIQGAMQQAISRCLAQGGVPGNATTTVAYDPMLQWDATVFMDCSAAYL